jgi:hypothetical protein
MLLYESLEPSAIQSVRFSPDAACLAVVTQADQVLWFEAGERFTPRGGWDSGIEIVDIAFSSTGDQLAVVGHARKPGGDYPESELTVLISEPFGAAPSARHRFPQEIDGRMVGELYTAPTFLPPPLRGHSRLVGTVDAVIGIDPKDGAARILLATTPDFGIVSRRGLVYLPATGMLFAAFDMHPNLWLIAYRRDGRGQFRELRELDCFIDGHHTGAALNPSGRLMAVGVQDAIYLHPAKAVADARVGAVHVYETTGLSKVGTFEVRGPIARDFGREQLAAGDGRRVPLGGGPDSPFVYLPLSMMSNPAFLDDRRVAFGMPGGQVRLLDVETGRVEVISDEPQSAIYRLDCAPAKHRIAAGFADGTVRVAHCQSGMNKT